MLLLSSFLVLFSAFVLKAKPALFHGNHIIIKLSVRTGVITKFAEVPFHLVLEGLFSELTDATATHTPRITFTCSCYPVFI